MFPTFDAVVWCLCDYTVKGASTSAALDVQAIQRDAIVPRITDNFHCFGLKNGDFVACLGPTWASAKAHEGNNARSLQGLKALPPHECQGFPPKMALT